MWLWCIEQCMIGMYRQHTRALATHSVSHKISTQYTIYIDFLFCFHWSSCIEAFDATFSNDTYANLYPSTPMLSKSERRTWAWLSSPRCGGAAITAAMHKAKTTANFILNVLLCGLFRLFEELLNTDRSCAAGLYTNFSLFHRWSSSVRFDLPTQPSMSITSCLEQHFQTLKSRCI